MYMYILTQVWWPCRDVIFHVWLKQTIRIFLPCKFTVECTSKRIFIILEVGIFQNQNCDFNNGLSSSSDLVRHFPGPAFSSQDCDLVRHFPGPAFSSLWSLLVRHFQVLQIQRPPSLLLFRLSDTLTTLVLSVCPSASVCLPLSSTYILFLLQQLPLLHCRY